MGMARTSAAVCRGLDAIGINPANLGYTDDATIMFTILPPTGLHVGSDFFDYDLYTSYFTGDEAGNGKYLNDNDKKRILEMFPGGLSSTYLDINSKIFSLMVHDGRWGSIGISVEERASLQMTIPEEYLKFLLEGNPAGSSYDFTETDFRAMWTREYSVSYGRHILPLIWVKSMTAGITLKLIQGIGYAEVVRNDTRFSTNGNSALQGQVDFQTRAAGVDFLAGDSGLSFTPFPAPAGTGYGLDLGISGDIDDSWSAAIALVDIGSITWRRNTREITGFTKLTLDDPFLGHQVDTLKDALKGESRPGGEFSTGLPTTLRIGVAYHLYGPSPDAELSRAELLLLAFDYNQGLTSYPGTTTSPRVSFGLEYKLSNSFPLRTGLSFGGTDKANVGFGFGLHFGPWELDFATENLGAVFFPQSFRHASLALGSRLKF